MILDRFRLDGRSGIGRGDRFILDGLDPATTIGVVNKIDGMAPEKVMEQLALAGDLGLAEYFPISASDTDERRWVAELVREQLLHITRDEVPHSVATRVTEWEWPRIRVEILVERDSQKGIVIGHQGQVLKDVGTRVRKQLAPGAFLELVVNVDDNWQQDRAAIERLGY